MNLEDASDYPELVDWLVAVDQDYSRGSWGHRFSKFSATFDLAGFTSLLHLERLTPENLVCMTGMEEIAARRLLRFAQEDISKVRATKPPQQKRARYSYWVTFPKNKPCAHANKRIFVDF